MRRAVYVLKRVNTYVANVVDKYLENHGSFVLIAMSGGQLAMENRALTCGVECFVRANRQCR